MNTFALIIAVAAVLVFLANTSEPTRRPWQLPFGLALFAAAFIIQLVFVHGPSITH